jgi:hypothetical protein
MVKEWSLAPLKRVPGFSLLNGNEQGKLAFA